MLVRLVVLLVIFVAVLLFVLDCPPEPSCAAPGMAEEVNQLLCVQSSTMKKAGRIKQVAAVIVFAFSSVLVKLLS